MSDPQVPPAVVPESALLKRLRAPGPKRMLALDGGGIRGLISLCFLKEIETILRRMHGRSDYLLCDYFDLIGGTSTGSIIASALALGHPVDEIIDGYRRLGARIFGRKRFRWWQSVFQEDELTKGILETVGEVCLGDSSVRTGLCIVTKRADTNSTWPLFNHPDGRFYEANRSYRLADIVRASVAAPVAFTPLRMALAPGQYGTFIDGGVGVGNSPALLMFLLATLKGFPFQWATGEQNLMLVSVGTGSWTWRLDAEAMARHKVWDWLTTVPAMIMQENTWMNQALLQYLSHSPTASVLDSEMGDLAQDVLGGTPALTYLRYNAALDADRLDTLGLSHLTPRVEHLRKLHYAEGISGLEEIGTREASVQVKPGHFPPEFIRKGERA